MVWYSRCSGAIEGARPLSSLGRIAELPKERRARVVLRKNGDNEGRAKRWMSLGADMLALLVCLSQESCAEGNCRWGESELFLRSP